MHESRITAVMPADGWSAALVRCYYDNGMRLYSEPLVGWALTETLDGEFEGDTRVEGVIVCPGLDYTILCYRTAYETSEQDHGLTYFCGYLRQGQDAHDYYEDAERTYKRWRHRETLDRRLFEAGWKVGGDGHFLRWVSPDGRKMSRGEAIKELRQGEGEG